MILSSGDIKGNYDIIKLVFACGASAAEGCFGKSCDPAQAYEEASQLLAQKANGMGANAVINIRFEFRVAQNYSNKQVFEAYVYGTAVKVKA
jgi:hypothetical protein